MEERINKLIKEKEYIERGAVVDMLRAITIRITPIEENRNMFYHDSGWNGASVAAKVEIGKIPAADVVEVVRCKDCIAKKGNIEPFECTRNNMIVYGNCYCAFGIRTPQKGE